MAKRREMPKGETPDSLKPYLYKPGQSGNYKGSSAKQRFQRALDKLLKEKVSVRSAAGDVVTMAREDLLANYVITLALDRDPAKHLVPLHAIALKHLLDRLDPVGTATKDGAQILINVQTPPQIQFADKVMRVANGQRINEDMILKALEDMPDESPTV